MNKHFGQVAARAIVLATTVSSASIAWAQSTPPTINAPPIRSPVDQNGVNLATGGLQMATTDLSIGSPGKGRLAHSRVWTGNGWRHGYFLNITTTSTTAAVSIGASTDTFTLSGGVYVSDQGSGATLTATTGSFTYTASDGTVVVFNRAYAGYLYYGTTAGLGTSITLPSGEQITLTYKTQSSPPITMVRLQSVNSSSGYQLKYEYGAAFWTISKVTAINNGIDYCDPTADSCTGLTQTWPSVSYATSTSGSNILESVTDPLNRVTRYTTDASSRLIGIKRPSSSTDNITIGYDANGRVSSVANSGATWSYSWSLGTTLNVTVTDPLSHQRVTTADPTKLVLLTDQDALSRTTTYQYDPQGRLTYIVPPEGTMSGTTPTAGYTKLDYDGRGNVTCSMKVSKTASSAQTCALPSTSDKIVTVASYSSSCTNQLTCNKPDWIRGPRSASGTDTTYETDYTYDSSTGFVLSVTSPTVGSVRPQTRYSYTAYNAYYKQTSGGSPTAASSSIYKLTSVSACATGSTCSGTSDEYKTTITYGPQTSGTANNLLPVTVTREAGTDSAITTNAYDSIGNIYTVDGPLAGTDDMTRYRFNAARELLGVVSPDPDGAGGSLKNRALRFTYNADGQTTQVEQGTVNSQSDPDWANFVTLAKQSRIYDGVGRLYQVEMPGTTTSNRRITQYSYDDANRQICTAVRMKFYATLDPVPADPCVVSTAGSYGSDRIAQNGYDAADELTSVITGYGTSVQRTDQTMTYTSNGVLQTIKDAKNNLTTYEYDGFDRLAKLRYPSPSTPNTSSTTDYEQYNYDAATNLISRRGRDGNSIGLTYDALNRVTAKDLPASEPDVSYGYDNIGHVTSASSSVASLSFTYDRLGRLTRQTSPQGNTDYQYDAASRRIRLTWPDSFYITYEYLLTNEMIAIRENGASSGAGVLATFSYDDAGRRTMLTRGNGTTTSYCYGGVTTQPGCSSTGSGFYLTGLAQNLTGTASDLNQDLAYNPASQITSQTRSNDAYAFRQTYNANRNYGTNGLNQYTAAGSAVPSYDSKGNLTAFWGQSYGYSSENLLTSATGTNGLSYDPALRLYQVNGATAVRMGYDGSDMIGEYNMSNALQRRYVFGPGSDEALVWYEGSGTTDRRWLHADERRSITAISDGSGSPITINSYDEYGMPATGNLGRFQYTGQMWLAETGSAPNGLYHYKARTYLPRLGRFMEADPIGYAGGLNLYAYVRNDPVNNTDPTGLRELCNNYSTYDGETITINAFAICFELPEQAGRGFVGNEGGGGGGGRGGTPPASPSKDPPQPKITCSTRLPNGKTIGQIVREQVKSIENASGDFDIGGVGEFGAFFATVQGHGPIDFKNTMGPDPTGRLGAAGNFAYGAIASGIGYSQGFAEFGAGVYAAAKGKSNFNNPFGEDNSAADNLGAGYATSGCTK